MTAERPFAFPPSPERALRHYSAETLTTGKDVINRIVGMIGEAQYSIDLQFYTFEADATGKKILRALQDAKKRNPRLAIRLLVDNSISVRHDSSFVSRNSRAREKRDETYELFNQLKEDGILDAKVTNWFPHNPILYSNIFHRDHKKLVTVDARDLETHPDAVPMALLTSANIAAYHEHGRKELGRVYYGTNGPVPFLQKDFEYSAKQAQEWENVYSVRSIGEYLHKYGLRKRFWSDAVGAIARNPQRPGERFVFTPGPKGHDSAVLTDSFYPKWFFGLGAREATNEAFTMLDLAQKGDTVILFTPYPGIFSLTGHLLKAAKRGADVHLIISQNYEHEFLDPKNLEGLEKILQPIYVGWPKRLARNGVTLHEYVGEKENNRGELHAKGAVWMRSDNTVRTLIGSTNFSKGPISGMNREIAVVEETDMSDPLVAYARSLIENSRIVAPNTRRTNLQSHPR